MNPENLLTKASGLIQQTESISVTDAEDENVVGVSSTQHSVGPQANVENEEPKYHYTLVRSLSNLLRRNTKSSGKLSFGQYCLRVYYNEKSYSTHIIDCRIHKPQVTFCRIRMMEKRIMYLSRTSSKHSLSSFVYLWTLSVSL